MADDYSVKELDSSEDPKFEITGKLNPIASDGSYHPELAKALFESGAIRKDRQFEIRILDGNLITIFRTNNPKSHVIYPTIDRSQGLVTSAVDHALTLKPYIQALNAIHGKTI